jgi:hypothetical protein
MNPRRRRSNGENEVAIPFDRVFAPGAFKTVWVGTYSNEPREGQQCAAKEFKEGSVYESFYFREEMHLISITQ